MSNTTTKKEEVDGSIITTTSNKNNYVLWITYINIVLYALCYQLQRPVEPYLIQSLTEKYQQEQQSSNNSITQTYGNLQSFFSFCQFFGSPLVGILLDRVGIRTTSCIVFMASAISYFILSFADNLFWVFISKIPTIFQAAFLVAQATAATSTGDDSTLRAAALGRMTTAYTIGATIGPALGGFLAGKGDFYAGAKLAVIGSLLSAILSLLFLPNKKSETKSNINNNNDDNPPIKKQRSFVDDLRRSKEIASRSNIWPLLMVKVLGGVCASMHSTALPIILTQTLHFEPQQLGLSMSVAMFSVAGFGAIAMAPITKIYGSFGMMNIGLFSRAGLGLVMATIVSFATTKSLSGDQTDITVIEVITVSVLYSLSQHILATGLTTQTTGSVDKEEQGSLLGLEHSLFSLARIGGPAIGTALLGFGNGGLWPVEIACGVFDVLLAVSLSINLPQSGKRKDS